MKDPVASCRGSKSSFLSFLRRQESRRRPRKSGEPDKGTGSSISEASGRNDNIKTLQQAAGKYKFN